MITTSVILAMSILQVKINDQEEPIMNTVTLRAGESINLTTGKITEGMGAANGLDKIFPGLAHNDLCALEILFATGIDLARRGWIKRNRCDKRPATCDTRPETDPGCDWHC